MARLFQLSIGSALPHSFGSFHIHRASSTSSKPYSPTLLLPKTDFTLRPVASSDDEIRHLTTTELWNWQSRQRDRPLWTIHDGPPYANGSIHMGHALNKILKDIINRSKLLDGFRIDYTPGFDCHGLPLELKAIESIQSLSSAKTNLDSIQVRECARKTASQGVDLQMKEFQQLSILADWNNAWKTMDHDYEIRQLEIFSQMVRNQLLFRQRKPVHFSPSSQTALAEAEIEYRDDHLSRSVFVAFDIVHLSAALKQVVQNVSPPARLRVVVWTTTPWTLVANQAVAVNKTAQYSLVKLVTKDSISEDLFIFASDRLNTLRDLFSDNLLELIVIAELSGQQLASSRYTHDFTFQDLPIFTADHVTVESGSGLVHTAPSHGLDDFHAYKAYMTKEEPTTDFSFIDLIDNQGKFHCDGDQEWRKRLHGKFALQDGNHEVICMLNEQGRLLGKEVKIRHKYPYDWRTKKPIMSKITSQWFVELKGIRQAALSMLSQINFYPQSSRLRLESFLKLRSEWCISRQRPWGVPIPVLYCMATQSPLLTHESVEWIVNVLKTKGVDYWWEGPVEDFVHPQIQGAYVKGVDTMDVWFDSGVSWSTMTGGQADLVLEGSDQHRGWFQSQLLTSLAFAFHPPNTLTLPVSQSIVTHGFTLDKQGRKMSKSIGNVLSPLQLINGDPLNKQPAFGVDVLRFWAASVDFTKDATIGVDQLSRLSDVVRKIRSTARFLLGNVFPKDVQKLSDADFSLQQLGMLEKYMLHLLHEFQQAVESAYTQFDFKQVVKQITGFTTHSLSAFYFETAKDILYNDSPDDSLRQGVIYVMSKILDIYLLSIAPILPHLAEEIQHHAHPAQYRASSYFSVFQKQWPNQNDTWKDVEVCEKMAPLLSIRNLLMSELELLRQAKKIRSSEEVELVIDMSSAIQKPYDGLKQLMEQVDILPRLFSLSDVSVCKTANSANIVKNLNSPTWTHSFEWRHEAYEDISLKLFLLPAWRSKCPRCWRFTMEEGSEVCARCTEVLSMR
ncbi:hypothetical protein O181_018689 [Austropuccinia psidii MF-1]|uniref:isoleucine--tRNA ligase n=1 Tax=Austropuccinia psidii MF-1 TaxID=1389203 RepID=A0A9Q3GU04_9BASI|nr:hypothetical protein [Austropuccinia psidii MF-1]